MIVILKKLLHNHQHEKNVLCVQVINKRRNTEVQMIYMQKVFKGMYPNFTLRYVLSPQIK